jgi:hypothetical protein
MEPPSDDEASTYGLVVEFVETKYHELRVASSDEDNRAAWPLAMALAGRLAAEYGAASDPPTLSPS